MTKSLNQDRHIKLYTFLLCFFTTLILILVGNKITPYLMDNDTFYFKTVLSGEMLGDPDYHTFYVGVVLGSIISFLYCLTGNGIAWFGIFACASMGSVFCYASYKIMVRCKKLITYIGSYVLSVLFLCFFMYRYFIETQYTLCSGILGAGAVFAFYLCDFTKSVKKIIPDIIACSLFALFSHSWREESFIMLFPFFGMVFIAKVISLYFKSKETAVKLFSLKNPSFKNLCIMILSVILCGGFSCVLYRICYITREWNEFKIYNTNRVYMFDYRYLPDYDSHKDLYESLGIKESSFEAMDHHYNLILDKNINASSMKALADAERQDLKEEGVSFFSQFGAVTKNIFRENLFGYTDRPLNVLVYWLYLLVVIGAITAKKWRVFIDLACLFVARMFDWYYLIFYDRAIFRVTQILYIAELLCLMAIIINYELFAKKETAKLKIPVSVLTSVMAVGVIGISLKFALPVMKECAEHSRAFCYLTVNFEEIERYIEDHPGNFYFFENSNIHFRYKTLECKAQPYENYVFMGTQLVNSPWYNSKLNAHEIKDPGQSLIDRDDLFIIYQPSEGYSRDYLDDYFDEHYPGSKISVADEFTSSNGMYYEILKVK
ncbi:MAG: hypothetical protein J6X48_03965 [Lachnospiraceae bacterium]|nr:hypothetical protein [Lachnospiraceae bacterium]